MVKLLYLVFICSYGEVVVFSVVIMVKLLGERSEPHTGVFNRDFA